MIYIIHHTIIGNLVIAEENGVIVAILPYEQWSRNAKLGESTLIRQAAMQIDEYLNGTRTTFDFPIAVSGTELQKKVWQALREIPYGKTCTYKDIAKRINHPLAYRAVGMACNRNKILLAIPCHRVLGTSGSLTGFAAGIDVKKKLLEIEGA